MREGPCELPRTWPCSKRSRTITSRPSRARHHAAAEPMAPAPTTTTSAEVTALFDGEVLQVEPVGPPPDQAAQRHAQELPEHAQGLSVPVDASELLALGAVGDALHDAGGRGQAALGDDLVDHVLDGEPLELLGRDGLEQPARDDPLAGGGRGTQHEPVA